jgi:hypothetical protein
MKYALKALAVAGAIAAASAGQAHASLVVDQQQTDASVYMSGFYQEDLAQSFTPGYDNVAGAGIYLDHTTGSGDVEVSIDLWSGGLPGQGGTHIAGGTASSNHNNDWLDVFWSPVAVTTGGTYFLVFDADNTSYGISGSTHNPYANGQVYANVGYGSFSNYDYTFRTYSNDAPSAAPEPGAWALMILGFGGLGAALRRRGVAVAA